MGHCPERHVRGQAPPQPSPKGEGVFEAPYSNTCTTPAKAGAQLGDVANCEPRSVTTTFLTGPRLSPGWRSKLPTGPRLILPRKGEDREGSDLGIGPQGHSSPPLAKPCCIC